MKPKKDKKIIPKDKQHKKKFIIKNDIKKRVKLKIIKTLTPFNLQIADVYVFPNKNILVNSVYGYKIYNDKYQCIKMKDHVNYSNIKIIDNDNFICLKDNKKLVNIGLKAGKIKIIYDFKEEISTILYHGNIYITYFIDDNNIKIWKKVSENKLQNSLNISFEEKKYIRIFLIPEKNILVASVDNENSAAYFIDLKQFKIINKLEKFFWNMYQLNDNNFILAWSEDCEYSDYLEIYDFNKNEIVKSIEYKFWNNCEILVVPKKEIFLVAGFTNNGFGCDRECKEIHVFDSRTYEEIFVLEKVHYRSILGIRFYEEKNEKESTIITYSEDGAVNFLSLI